MAGRTSHERSTYASRRRRVTGRVRYRNSGGGARSSTSTFGPSSKSSRIGLDQQRAALALGLPDPFDTRKPVLQIGRIAEPRLIHIQQISGELRRIGLGQVDPADALALLHDAGALRQIEGEPRGGAVIRREHACCADTRPHRLDFVGGFAPADADAAHGGIAAIAGQHAGVGLHHQQHEHHDAARHRPAPAEIDQALRARLPLRPDARRRRRRSRTPDRPAQTSWPRRGHAANARRNRRR